MNSKIIAVQVFDSYNVKLRVFSNEEKAINFLIDFIQCPQAKFKDLNLEKVCESINNDLIPEFCAEEIFVNFEKVNIDDC